MKSRLILDLSVVPYLRSTTLGWFLLDLAENIDNFSKSLEEGFCLEVRQSFPESSSYHRTGFNRPMCLHLRIMHESGGPETAAEYCSLTHIAIWNHPNGPRCLVMFDRDNRPENNFDGSYDDAVHWTSLRLKERLDAHRPPRTETPL